ncbi:MAG TPA: NAD(P)/FAD-dependent oxidoreductase [Gemmatimonadaceae bacterium]|nr:NAD(P)/FAD-dependent oxidoreductase [Gemmatimonadaceae bacterium]
MTRSSVIVVGGGPAGASTAFGLARNGVDVLLIDRAHFPRDKPCAEYLSPEAARPLHEMGALAAIDAEGPAHLHGMRVRAPGGDVIHGEFAAAHGFHGFRDRGLALRRTVLDAILLDRARAAGAEVVEGERVESLLVDARGAACGVATVDAAGARRERRAAFVVGADGLRSIVARRAGLAHQRRWPRRVAVIAHATNVTGVGHFGEMHVERDGYAGLADVGHGVTNVAVVVPFAQAGALRGDALGFLQRWLDRRPHLAPRLRGARYAEGARVTGPFASHARRAWAPGLALVGDAADFFDPFTGEGIFAALRGGELLAPYLCHALGAANDRDADAALAAYDRARRHLFAGKWRVERLIGSAVAMPAVMNRAAAAMSARRDLADLLVGVTGDFVPPREVMRPSFIARLLVGAIARRPPVPHPIADDRLPTPP